MKIDKVVLGSDDNPFYLDFWPIVSRIWRLKFGIEPILYLFTDNTKLEISEEYGKVYYNKILPDVPINVQAQWCRYWAPSTDLDATWMISDIDMLPISKHYFINLIADVPDDKLCNTNSQVIGGFSACYNIAKGKTFKEILGLPDTFEESVKKTKFWENDFVHNIEDGKGNLIRRTNWCTDETYSNSVFREYHAKDPTRLVIKDRPGGFCARRLDRGNEWGLWRDELVLQEYYLDAHCPRPYGSYKNSIDKLVNLIMTGCKNG